QAHRTRSICASGVRISDGAPKKKSTAKAVFFFFGTAASPQAGFKFSERGIPFSHRCGKAICGFRHKPANRAAASKPPRFICRRQRLRRFPLSRSPHAGQGAKTSAEKKHNLCRRNN
ncbi:MAG: hypothetical protein IKL99_03605, partial [Oscillospiraceae bacterium]|nr:hypothetical protein [Oscillospiraceae bacterium]